MSDIGNTVSNAVNIIDRFEDAIASGSINGAVTIINDNAAVLSKTMELIINCFAAIDPNDEEGYIQYYTDLLKDMVLALKSVDILYVWDVFCAGIRNSMIQFLEIIGE